MLLVLFFAGGWTTTVLGCALAERYGEHIRELLLEQPSTPIPPRVRPVAPPLPAGLAYPTEDAVEAGFLRVAREAGKGVVRCELPPDTPPLDLGQVWLRDDDTLIVATTFADDSLALAARRGRGEGWELPDVETASEDEIRSATSAMRQLWDPSGQPIVHLAWTGAHPGTLGTCTVTAAPFPAPVEVRLWVYGPRDQRVKGAWVSCTSTVTRENGRVRCWVPAGLDTAFTAYHDAVGTGRVLVEDVSEGEDVVLRLRPGEEPSREFNLGATAEEAARDYPDEADAIRAYVEHVDVRERGQERIERKLDGDYSFLLDQFGQ